MAQTTKAPSRLPNNTTGKLQGRKNKENSKGDGLRQTLLDRHFHVVRKSKETTDNNDKNNEKAKETKAESIKERKLKTDRKTVRLSPFVRSSNSDGDLSDSEKTKKNDTQKKMKKIPIVRYSDSEEDLFEDSESYENRVARSTSQSQQDESSSLSEEMEIGEDEEPCKIIMGPDSLGSDDIADIYPSYIQEEELAVIAEKRRKNLEGESETNAKVPRLSNAQEATPNDSPDPNIIDISSSQDSIDSISSTPTYLISDNDLSEKEGLQALLDRSIEKGDTEVAELLKQMQQFFKEEISFHLATEVVRKKRLPHGHKTLKYNLIDVLLGTKLFGRAIIECLLGLIVNIGKEEFTDTQQQLAADIFENLTNQDAQRLIKTDERLKRLITAMSSDNSHPRQLVRIISDFVVSW